MSEDKRWQFELEEYIRQGEPEQAEKSEAWQIAIGLQQVDGLKTSACFFENHTASGRKDIPVFTGRMDDDSSSPF